MAQTQKIIVIAGPTASGKTKVAVELARKINAEIIGADSMQVYKKMDIGTAKPTEEELNGIKHYLLDVAEPNEDFDAVRFVSEADKALKKILAEKKRVILAGGTGLYIKSFLYGLHKAPAPNPKLREEFKKRINKDGLGSLYIELKKLDPESANKIHVNDGVRIIRALEVVMTSGKKMSDWQKEHGFKNKRYPFLMIGLTIPMEELAKRIRKRTDIMMQNGFLKEVTNLLDEGYSPKLKSMQSLGYRHLVSFLTGKTTLEGAVENIKLDTRRFAKRQLTWFKSEKEIIHEIPDVPKLLKIILKADAG